VKLHGDFLHVDDMDTEDLRLAYVASTRAKITLDRTAWDSTLPLEVILNSKSTPKPATRQRPPLKPVPREEIQTNKGLSGRINDWRKR